MGYSVPAGVAAKLVHPDRLVVSCVGDGGFVMTGQEV
jgi:acetolactate synthase-1/2/3 large subunit